MIPMVASSSYMSMHCDQFGIECKPTTIKNPQVNSMLKRLHDVLGNMLCTNGLTAKEDLDTLDMNKFTMIGACSIHSTLHAVFGWSPVAATISQGIVFNLLYNRLDSYKAQ